LETKDFAESFIGRLARADFHVAGSLDEYLLLSDARRSGDEANVVDSRITRALLEALGFATAEIDYNASKENLRPDFVVRIRDYPECCFVVEDKATVELHLEAHRPQLASYMAANRCPRGLLVNGRRLFGYDDAGPGSSASLEFSLGAAVRTWRGKDLLSGGRLGWDALPQQDRDTLAVIARRYGRDAFQGVTRLIDDLTLDRDGKPHATDGSTWTPGRTRLPITDARHASSRLVEAVQELIAELREDVAVQFATRNREYAIFLQEIERSPGSTALAADVIESITERLLSVVPASEASRRDRMRTLLARAMRGERPAAEIDEVVEEIGGLVGRQANGRTTDGLGRAGAEAASFANRYSRHLTSARDRHAAAVQAVEAFERWRTAVGTLLFSGISPEKVQDEYFAQTAYLVIVRMLLVRVLEDKSLTPRVFTNGGAALWFRQVEPHYFSLAMGRSVARLLEIAYENAQATYAHFYDDHRVFDWYVPDRITVVRVLHRLAGFDLAATDRDIIGTVYGRFVNDRHKKEQGMYYTPAGVVSFILDRIGWNGSATVGARMLDPACGSGAFLVEAARRTIDAHRAQAHLEGHAEIPAERVQLVLDSLRDGLVGFDLNPFACALAEINLLVQVLDLVVHAHRHRQPARLDRFRIYSTDALRLSVGARAALEAGLDRAEVEDLPEEEQAKAGIGIFSQGFDAVVGNPPYVRADEGTPGLEAYRRQIKTHPVVALQKALIQKWDLFVPFVALGCHLLRRDNGRLGMIVSNALETVPYASELRRLIVTASSVEEIHFFEPGVKLFEDAAVRNTILVVRSGLPAPGAETLREWHGGPPPLPLRRQRLRQTEYATEIFRPALPGFRVPAGAKAEALRDICYVSVGMVLSANEKLDGGRYKGAFELDDLLTDRPDPSHPRPYVGSEDLRIAGSLAGDFLFAAARIRYLEFGTDRVPALIRRPTFPELYDRDKIIVGEFGGALYDDGRLDPLGYLMCNHSVFLFLPWHLLTGVQNRSLRARELKLKRTRVALERISANYPLPFLAGLLNSTVWDKLMQGRATTSIAGRAQPNNYADQLVPLPDAATAAAVGQAADAARDEGRALGRLLSAGWQRNADGWRAPVIIPPEIQDSAFAVARTRWRFIIERPATRCSTLRREGVVFLSGRNIAARLPEGFDELAADFLLRMLTAQGNASLQSIEAGALHIPVRPEDAAVLERECRQREAEALAREQTILARRADIDRLLAPLFEEVVQPAVEILA
jgi:type I restriction enzyme M protein